jgi:acyl carrier protein
MMDVAQRITGLLADLLVLRPDEVRPEHLLVDDLDADSITFLELWFRLEQDFGLDLPEVKADEETFNLPLLEGLGKLEALGGGTTLFEFARQEVMARGLPMAPDIEVEVVRAALDPEQRTLMFRSLTIGELLAILRGRLPGDLQPETRVADLRLKDFFRFLTVDMLIQYVSFMLDVQRAAAAASDDTNG